MCHADSGTCGDPVLLQCSGLLRLQTCGGTVTPCSDTAIVTTGTRAKKAGLLPPISRKGMERCSHRSWGLAPPLIPVPWIWMASPGSRLSPAERRMGSLARGMGGLTTVPCPTLTSAAVSGGLGGRWWWLGVSAAFPACFQAAQHKKGAESSAGRSGGGTAFLLRFSLPFWKILWNQKLDPQQHLKSFLHRVTEDEAETPSSQRSHYSKCILSPPRGLETQRGGRYQI